MFEALSPLASNIKRHLLDIDDRLTQFYSEDQFTQYNMFNNHFFNDRAGFENFVDKSKNVLICMDPPFGGIVKLIANTIQLIKKGKLKRKRSMMIYYKIYHI